MPTQHAITTSKGKKEFFDEWKAGNLNIGKSDQTVPHTPEGQRQAVAIYLSKTGKSKKKRISQVKKSDAKYLEGLCLSSFVSADTPTAYSEAMLNVLHGDTKQRVRVNAPHTKQGYYYRTQEVADKPLPTHLIAAGAAGLAAGAAIGVGAGLWFSQDGTRKKVEAARAAADARVQSAVGQAQREGDDRLREQADRLQQESSGAMQAQQSAHQQEMAQMREQMQQREAEIADRIHSEAQRQLFEERERIAQQARTAAIDEERTKRIAKGRTGRALLDDDAEGIALGASMKRGFDPMTAANLPRQVNDAVDRIINRQLQAAHQQLATGFRARFSDIQKIGSDKPAQTQKQQETRINMRWQAMEQAMQQQLRREGHLEDGFDKLRSGYKQQYQQALEKLQSDARQRGGYHPELVDRFDKASKSLNKKLQADMQKAAKAAQDMRLDDFWKTIQVKAGAGHKAYKRRVRSAQQEISQVVRTGRGKERDIKPLIEQVAVKAATIAAPAPLKPIAAGAATAGSRIWRLSYEDVVQSGLPGLIDGFRNLSQQDKQALCTDSLVAVASTAAGGVAGHEAARYTAGSIDPVASLGGGTTAGISTARATTPVIRHAVRKVIQDAAYWSQFNEVMSRGQR